MDIQIFFEKLKEFDRQIREARNAAIYALTLDEKLDAMNQAKAMAQQKVEFRKHFLNITLT
jgi:hypothetical protein